MATKSEVSSLLACGDRFHEWARSRISNYDRATVKAGQEGRARLLKQREEARVKQESDRAKREAEDMARSKVVEYCLSHPEWSGVASFEFTHNGQHRRTALLTLTERPSAVAIKENKLFPQVAIMAGGVTVLATMHTLRGWSVKDVQLNGCEILIEVANAEGRQP